jgi:hypothetical protein
MVIEGLAFMYSLARISKGLSTLFDFAYVSVNEVEPPALPPPEAVPDEDEQPASAITTGSAAKALVRRTALACRVMSSLSVTSLS